MSDPLLPLSYEIELQPGELLTLPPGIAERVGPGRWVITISPANHVSAVRDHSAFLKGYAPGDEGLYDADPTR